MRSLSSPPFWGARGRAADDLVVSSPATDETREPLADLEEFVHDHRPGRPMTGDVPEAAWNGYRLTVGPNAKESFDFVIVEKKTAAFFTATTPGVTIRGATKRQQ